MELMELPGQFDIDLFQGPNFDTEAGNQHQCRIEYTRPPSGEVCVCRFPEDFRRSTQWHATMRSRMLRPRTSGCPVPIPGHAVPRHLSALGPALGPRDRRESCPVAARRHQLARTAGVDPGPGQQGGAPVGHGQGLKSTVGGAVGCGQTQPSVGALVSCQARNQCQQN